MPRTRTFLTATGLLFVAMAFLGLWFFSRGGWIPKKGRAFYVQILEENRDTFASRLFVVSSRRGPAALIYRNGRIKLHPDLESAIRKGEAQSRYGLVEAPDPFDLAKITLCVHHIITYAGRGREAAENRYYFLSKWPATLSLEPYADTRNEVLLPFSDPLSGLLKLRFLGNNLEMIRGGEKELQIRYEGQAHRVSDGQEVFLGESSRRLRVRQEYLGPIPLGPVNPAEIQIKTTDQGAIDFSTTLKVRSEGWSELVFGEAK